MAPLLPLVPVFIVSALAETARTPFDLPEAESELVAGFMTELSAAPFVLYFLSLVTLVIFVGGTISNLNVALLILLAV